MVTYEEFCEELEKAIEMRRKREAEREKQYMEYISSQHQRNNRRNINKRKINRMHGNRNMEC